MSHTSFHLEASSSSKGHKKKKKKAYFSLLLCVLEGSAAALRRAVCILGPSDGTASRGTWPVVLAGRRGRRFHLKVTAPSAHISLVRAGRVAKPEVPDGGAQPGRDCVLWSDTWSSFLVPRGSWERQQRACPLPRPVVQHRLCRTAGSLHSQGRQASPLPRTRPHSDASCRVAWLCPELGAPAPQSLGRRVLRRVFCSNPSLGCS